MTLHDSVQLCFYIPFSPHITTTNTIAKTTDPLLYLFFFFLHSAPPPRVLLKRRCFSSVTVSLHASPTRKWDFLFPPSCLLSSSCNSLLFLRVYLVYDVYIRVYVCVVCVYDHRHLWGYLHVVPAAFIVYLFSPFYNCRYRPSIFYHDTILLPSVAR